MLILSNLAQVNTETQCGFIEVEEHLGCQCDCPVQPHHCRSDQYYEMSSCRCLCQDQAGRNQCIMSGKQWDPVNCMCLCPTNTWRVCSTGYIFDLANTCQCVPTSTTASVGLLVAVIMLVTCILVSVVGGYLMYRNKIGLFRTKSRKAGSKSLSDQDLMNG